MRLCKVCAKPAIKKRLLCKEHNRQEHREFVRKTRTKEYVAKKRWNTSVEREVDVLFPPYMCPLNAEALFAIGTFYENR